MPLNTAIGAEVIPGYQLIERIGAGGYGEVWKVKAPGGLMKAAKIIFGQVGEARAEQELKALSRIREVRHPFLLSLERFEIVDSQLIIITELADSSLLERFAACVDQKLPGIPREELMAYIRDAADALDYMNESHGLQHLDIKPENLLIVGGRIKVADFGLVKDFHAARVTVTSGVTAVYATPEAFDGKVSRFSDQYSLAIVYQEMLTGVRPFPGTTTFQLAFQHTSCPPQLESLPPGDRPIIGRSLAKIPEERFPRCGDMVACLQRTNLATVTPLLHQAEVQGLNQAAASIETPSNLVDDEVISLDVARIFKGELEEVREPAAATSRPEIAGTSVPFSATQTRLRPTLFLGVGPVGAWTLRRLRRRLIEHFDRLDRIPIFRFLLIDTDREPLRKSREGGVMEALSLEETLLLPLHRPEHYKPKAKQLLQWLDRGWLYGIPASCRTEGMRPLGRLAFVDNSREVLQRIREALAAAVSPAAQSATQQSTGVAPNELEPRVYLVGSVADGNSGMLLDLAYAVRQVLAELGISAEGLCGILAHVTSPKPAEQALAKINAYATLRELCHFSREGRLYPGDADLGLKPLVQATPPFSDCFICQMGEGLGDIETDAATDRLASFLYLDVATPATRAFSSYRDQTRRPADSERPMELRTFGLSRIAFPRQLLAERVGDLLCKTILQRWRGPGEALPPEAIEAEANQLVSRLGFTPEALIEQLNTMIATALGGEQEEVLRDLLPDNVPTGAAQATFWVEQTKPILSAIDDVLGKGAGDDESQTTRLFELSLSDQANRLGTGVSVELLDWLRAQVENPEQRLIAAAQYSRWIQDFLSSAIARVGSQRAQFRNYRDLLRGRLLAGELTGKRSGVRWLGMVRRQSVDSGPAGKFLEYWQVRLAEIALNYALDVLNVLTRSVSTFAQDLADAQQRLSSMAQRAETGQAGAPSRPPRPPGTMEVFPGSASDLSGAAKEMINGLEAGFLVQLDASFQRLVLAPHGGLWEVLRSGELSDAVSGELRRRARLAMLSAMKHLDAARNFLQARPKPSHIRQSLVKVIQHSNPILNVTGAKPHLLIAVPGGKGGETIETIIARIVPDLPTTVIDSDGDVIVCQEVAMLPIAEVVEAIVGDNATTIENAGRVLIRTDIDWEPLPRRSARAQNV